MSDLSPTQFSPDILRSVGRAILADVNACTTDEQLVATSRKSLDALVKREITPQEQHFLACCIDQRRPARRSVNAVSPVLSKVVSGKSGRSIFPARRYQRRPDWTEAKRRQRQLGGSGALPDQIRKEFPEAQRAVLTVIGFDAQRKGKCDAHIDSIAARAGVCRSTVQAAIRLAVKLGLLIWTERSQENARGTRYAPNLTNVIRIASRAWQRWLARGIRSLGEVVAGFKSTNTQHDLHPMKNPNLIESWSLEEAFRVERPQGAWSENRRSGLRLPGELVPA